MEESQETVLNWMAKSGVPIPAVVSSIKDLTPPMLVSICSHSLRLLDKKLSFPTAFPESVSDRYKICTDLASAFKNLGYIGDINFHKFLYPSEEDIQKLLRFLIERLSELSEGKEINKNKRATTVIQENSKITSDFISEKDDNNRVCLHDEVVISRLNNLTLKTEIAESSVNRHEDAIFSDSDVQKKVEEVSSVNICTGGTPDSSKKGLTVRQKDKHLGEEFEDSLNIDLENQETVAYGDKKHFPVPSRKEGSLPMHSSQLKQDIEQMQRQKEVIMEEVNAKTSELLHLQKEHELLKAVEIAFDKQHPTENYILQLNEQVEARKQSLVQLESQWDALIKPLEDKKKSMEVALKATEPEAYKMIEKLNEVELETESILSEIKRREDALSKLSLTLEEQPKLASRRSHIDKIKEIAKNSRKQDADINQILKETRELQLESNSIQERLHRTYIVLDEIIFREAKKDPVGEKAYRLLTGIHEHFEKLSEKILATDRARREAADREAKLAALASRSLNIYKLQADLDAIRRENDLLERRLSTT